MAEKTPKNWAVVGGGALGMTLALRLLVRGQRVTLLEAAPELGGLASAWRLGDVTWDRHYHVTLLSDDRLRNLLSEIGLEDEMRWVETKTGFFTGGQMHSMSSSVEFLKFPPLTLTEKLRLGGTIFLASKLKNWRRLETIPVADWLRKWSGRGVFEKVWEPLLLAKLGEAYKETSAAFIWAYINRMYKARRSGLKREMFGYARGGYARVLDRLAEVLRQRGARIETDAPVHEAVSLPDGGVEVAFGDDRRERFDNVVFTTPSPVIAESCPQMPVKERMRHEQVKYLGIVCASLLLKKPITPYYVTNITDRWVPLTAVIEMTTVVSPEELGGNHLVYLPKYAMSDDPIFNTPDEQLREEWIATLEKMHPHFSRDDVLAFQVSRARRVMALPTLRYSGRLPSVTTGVPGIFAVNSAQILEGTLNVDETIRIADEAAEGVLAEEISRESEPGHTQSLAGSPTPKQYESPRPSPAPTA